jgi:hypothetical protein
LPARLRETRGNYSGAASMLGTRSFAGSLQRDAVARVIAAVVVLDERVRRSRDPGADFREVADCSAHAGLGNRADRGPLVFEVPIARSRGLRAHHVFRGGAAVAAVDVQVKPPWMSGVEPAKSARQLTVSVVPSKVAPVRHTQRWLALIFLLHRSSGGTLSDALGSLPLPAVLLAAGVLEGPHPLGPDRPRQGCRRQRPPDHRRRALPSRDDQAMIC